MVAICANDNRLQIYEGCNSPSFASWRLAHVLEEHDLIISGISWSPVTNKIVTCSHDRNAFVWSYDAAQVIEKKRSDLEFILMHCFFLLLFLFLFDATVGE